MTLFTWSLLTVACSKGAPSGTEDPPCTEVFFADADRDGHGNPDASVTACSPASGYSETADDCDDNRADVRPGADEICNGVDDDCDGETDVGATDESTWYADADHDGFGDDSAAIAACAPPSEYVAVGGDCADDDPAVHPKADELCNGTDDDCDELVDSLDPSLVEGTVWYDDLDHDGYGDPSTGARSCEKPGGRIVDGSDCDDTNDAIHPGVDEMCDGSDNDCDGLVDGDDGCEVVLADADLVLEGMDGELIGWPIATGDPTGDGIDDVVIGSQNLDDNTGGVYVVAGPASGTLTASDVAIDIEYTGTVQLQFGVALATEDINADSVDDVVVGSLTFGTWLTPARATLFTFLGPITGSRTQRDADTFWDKDDIGDLGYELVAAPDLTGDAIGDLLAGTWGSTGGVYVLSGAASGGTHEWDADATYIYTNTSSHSLGLAVTDLADASGDGVADFAFQSDFDVVVIEGGDTPGTYDAPSVASATLDLGHQALYLASGDYDDDGYGDLFVPGTEMTAFFGPLSGSVSLGDASASWSSFDKGLFPDWSARYVGSHAIAVGDADGDGERDVLMGATDAEPPSGGHGTAFLQRGLVTGAVDVGTLVSFPAGAYDSIGASAAFVTDWTGDGGDEIALGSYGGYSKDRRGAIHVVSSDQIF